MHASRVPSVPPPRRGQPATPVPLSRLWSALPVESRRKILRALSRALARQLGPPSEPAGGVA
jgi:hypothetical protein